VVRFSLRPLYPWGNVPIGLLDFRDDIGVVTKRYLSAHTGNRTLTVQLTGLFHDVPENILTTVFFFSDAMPNVCTRVNPKVSGLAARSENCK
jgi:hypothetical protein